MENNVVLAKLKRGEPTLGCFVGLGSPNVVELLGHAGVDWLVLETEHNGLDAAEVEDLLRAADTTPAVPSRNIAGRYMSTLRQRRSSNR